MVATAVPATCNRCMAAACSAVIMVAPEDAVAMPEAGVAAAEAAATIVPRCKSWMVSVVDGETLTGIRCPDIVVNVRVVASGGDEDVTAAAVPATTAADGAAAEETVTI